MSETGLGTLQRQLDFAEAAHEAALERMADAWAAVLVRKREFMDTGRRVRDLKADIETLKVAA